MAGSNVPANPYRTRLAQGGVIALVLGAVMAFFGNNAAQEATNINEFSLSMGGLDLGGDPGATGHAWMFAGFAFLAIGSVLLISWLIIRAANEK